MSMVGYSRLGGGSGWGGGGGGGGVIIMALTTSQCLLVVENISTVDWSMQKSATGAGCCWWLQLNTDFHMSNHNELHDLWKSASTNHSITVHCPVWPRTSPKIMPRYVWHGPTFPVPHSKTGNQYCLNISSTVGNHLNNTASVFCVLTWLVQCSPNQISLNFNMFFLSLFINQSSNKYNAEIYFLNYNGDIWSRILQAQ